MLFNFFQALLDVKQYDIRKARKADIFMTQENTLQYSLRSVRYAGAKSGPTPMGGGGGGALPSHETICRKILLSCRNFCALTDWFWRILRRNNASKGEFISVKR